MLISYNTEQIRDVCFRESIAMECLGDEAAILLQARHSDIVAANNVFELPFGGVTIYGNSCVINASKVL